MNNNKIYKLLKPQTMVKLLKLMLVPTNPPVFMGFPEGSRVKRICLQCRGCASNLWVRKIPWRRKWQPNLVFLSGKFLGQRIWQATAHGVTGVGHNLVTKPRW